MAESIRRYPVSTTRIGLIFVTLAIVVCLCAVAVTLLDLPVGWHRMLWIVSLGACALGGIVAMHSLRTLRTIETEIRHLGKWDGFTGDPLAKARAVISADPVAESWNGLLDCFAEIAQPSQPERSTAPLDQQVITLARAMRSLPIAWVVTDHEGQIQQINGTACTMLAADEPEKLMGTPIADLFSTDDSDSPQAAQSYAETLSQAFDRLLSQVRLVNQDIQVTIAGQSTQLRITRSRIGGRSGDGQGLAWIMTDITRQKQAIESRDQFLMTATHELRSPLTNLQAYAEALVAEDELEIDQQKEFCNTIHSEANRLGRLIDQLLTVSQMEAGALVASRNEIEILPMIQYAIDQLDASAKQKNLTLTCDLPAKLPTIFGDRDKLQAAIVNLVGNAVKYTPQDGQITVTARQHENKLAVAVEDNGTGIPAEEHEKVFQKFYRCNSAATVENTGNGLGLAFAREIARLHGGDVTLESVPGQGSTFTISLPAGGLSRSGV